MSRRRMTDARFKAECIDTDISLTFWVPQSKFGAVEVVYTVPDAEALHDALGKALTEAYDQLEAEGIA